MGPGGPEIDGAQPAMASVESPRRKSRRLVVDITLYPSTTQPFWVRLGRHLSSSYLAFVRLTPSCCGTELSTAFSSTPQTATALRPRFSALTFSVSGC